MKRINSDVKLNTFEPVYLLYGDETFLKKSFKKKLLSALVNEGDTLNFSQFTRETFNENQIVDLAYTMPFLAERRVILIEESDCMKKSCEKLADYFKEPNPDAVVIFIETDIDKRNALFKAVSKFDRAIELVAPNDEDMMRWIGTILTQAGKQMDRSTFDEFYARSSISMDNVVSELEKLICYVGDRPQITLNDVVTMTVERPDSKVFGLLDGMMEKDLKKAMDVYNDLLLTKEPPMSILYNITSQFRTLLAVKELSDRGENTATMARYLNAQEWKIKKLLRCKNSFSYGDINSLLDYAADLEAAFKSGRLSENLAVELILTKYSA